MSTAIVFVLGANLLFIGLLPKIFFKRDGKFNFMWWATALPFFSAAVVLVLGYAGLITPGVTVAGLAVQWSETAAMLLSVGSIALMAFTLGTHNRRIALWHQTNDAPEHIVTHGAYKYVRHPFYSAFLLALLALVCLVPHYISAMIFIYALSLLNYTARREESHLSGSVFGEEYKAYKARTGRFIPTGNSDYA